MYTYLVCPGCGCVVELSDNMLQAALFTTKPIYPIRVTDLFRCLRSWVSMGHNGYGFDAVHWNLFHEQDCEYRI